MSSNELRQRQHIAGLLEPIIDEYKLQMACEHDWKEYGFGFQCSKCDYYTGLDSDLNELIKKQAKQPTNEQ